MSDYFKSDQTYIYLKKPYCEFYLPQSYFEGMSGFSEDLGQMIRGLGVFVIGFFENGKLKEYKTMAIPTTTEVYVNDYENRMVDLPGSGPTMCKVLKFFEGDKVMNSTTIDDSSNAELYLKFVTQGKVPKTIPYDKALMLWRRNQEMNGVHLGVPAVIEELILSVSYRDKNNPGRKFSHVIGKDPENVSPFDYTMASIRQICQYTSTFTALTFEDMDSMITTSLNRTREHNPEAASPIESLIKM